MHIKLYAVVRSKDHTVYLICGLMAKAVLYDDMKKVDIFAAMEECSELQGHKAVKRFTFVPVSPSQSHRQFHDYLGFIFICVSSDILKGLGWIDSKKATAQSAVLLCHTTAER